MQPSEWSGQPFFFLPSDTKRQSDQHLCRTTEAWHLLALCCSLGCVGVFAFVPNHFTPALSSCLQDYVGWWHCKTKTLGKEICVLSWKFGM